MRLKGELRPVCSKCAWQIHTVVDRTPADPVMGRRLTEMPPETRSRIVPSGNSAVFETLPVDRKSARRGT